MSEKAYNDLADWLVSTFRALPGVKSPELMDILRHQYTAEEGQLAVTMGAEGGRIDALMEKTGMTKDELMPLIQSMEEKGTMYTEPGSRDPIYKPLGMEALGIVETVSWGDNSTPFKKKLNELWYKFKPIYVNEGVAKIGKVGTLWCNWSVLPPDATPEENLKEQIKAVYEADDAIAVTGCPCRIIDKHGTNAECGCVVECCFSFGEMARWAVEKKWARQVSLDECLAIIEKCHEHGQVTTGYPAAILCNCCKHACINFYGMKLGKDHIYYGNHFYAIVDPEECNACGECVDRCPVEAIQLDSIAEVDTEKCLGCGACAAGCDTEALKMVRKAEEEIERLDAEVNNGLVSAFSKATPNWDVGM